MRIGLYLLYVISLSIIISVTASLLNASYEKVAVHLLVAIVAMLASRPKGERK